MTHTYTQLDYHLVWSTKNREPIITPLFQERLYEYIGGVFRDMNSVCLEIGGVADHLHILARISSTVSISDLIRDVKASSTRWMQKEVLRNGAFSWQEGYGAFSVSPSHLDPITQYIKNQAEHHKSVTFKEEFLRILDKNKVNYEEKYLWK